MRFGGAEGSALGSEGAGGGLSWVRMKVLGAPSDNEAMTL